MSVTKLHVRAMIIVLLVDMRYKVNGVWSTKFMYDGRCLKGIHGKGIHGVIDTTRTGRPRK